MSKHAKYAFSLIELLIVLAIMSSVIAILLGIRVKNPKTTGISILSSLNSLMYVARQEVVATKQIHRIFFSEKKGQQDLVLVQKEVDNPDIPKQKKYIQVEPRAFSHFAFPAEATIHAIYLNGKEVWMENKSRGISFFIKPNSVMPDLNVQVEIKTEKDKDTNKVSYILEPYIGRFKLLDGWVKSQEKHLVRG